MGEMCYTQIYVLYGIRRSLIDICSITEVKRRRARFISGWVTTWDCQVPYTLSWGSEKHVDQMDLLTAFKLDVKEPQRTSAQFPSGETPKYPQYGVLWHIYKAMNDIMNDNRPC